MTGRLEKELAAEQKMNKRLASLPSIFTEYYTFLRAARRTFTTLYTYMYYISHFGRFICNSEHITEDFYKNVTTQDIERYLISLETRVSKGAIVRTGTDILCTRWSALNAFWQFLVKRGYVDNNVVATTSRPQNTSDHEVVYLTKKEISRLMRAIPDDPYNIIAQRDKTMIAVTLATGLRISALVNLNVEDVDLDNSTISVIEKRNKYRTIGIGEQTVGLLQEWIKLRNKEFKGCNTNALFISQQHNRISTYAANHALKKYAEDAGISKPNFSWHKLRATVACQMSEAHMPITAIADRLSHNNIATTQRYVTATDEQREKTVKLLDELYKV